MNTVIIGAGTTAMIVADIILKSHNFILAGFVGTQEEEKQLQRSKLYNGMPFLGDHSILPKLKDDDITGFIAAIGDNKIREQAYFEAIEAGLSPINAVSPDAIVNTQEPLGRGIIISPGCVISHGVQIGDNVIMDPSVVVDVNSDIGAHSCLCPGVIVCGGSTIEKRVRLGAGTVVESEVKVGKNQVVEARSLISEDLPRLYRDS